MDHHNLVKVILENCARSGNLTEQTSGIYISQRKYLNWIKVKYCGISLYKLINK